MSGKFKSVFSTEMETNLILRKEELGSDAFRHYQHTVKLFDDYLYNIGLKEKLVDESVVEGWIKSVSKGISIKTIGGYINCVRQLLLYLVKNGYSCFIPKNMVSKDTYVPYLYTDHDIESIFETVDSFTAPNATVNIYISYEMPLLLRLLLCCGLRVGETVNIKVGDIDFNKKLIVLRVTKKCKQRLVPYDEHLAEIIYRYCIAMKFLNDPEAYLFPSNNKYDHVSPGTVNNYFRVIRRKSGIVAGNKKSNSRGVCLHCFRHTFAVKSFDQNERRGLSPREAVPFLSTYLGHDSLLETEKYLKYGGDYFGDTLTKFEAFAEELFPEVSFDE